MPTPTTPVTKIYTAEVSKDLKSVKVNGAEIAIPEPLQHKGEEKALEWALAKIQQNIAGIFRSGKNENQTIKVHSTLAGNTIKATITDPRQVTFKVLHRHEAKTVETTTKAASEQTPAPSMQSAPSQPAPARAQYKQDPDTKHVDAKKVVGEAPSQSSPQTPQVSSQTVTEAPPSTFFSQSPSVDATRQPQQPEPQQDWAQHNTATAANNNQNQQYAPAGYKQPDQQYAVPPMAVEQSKKKKGWGKKQKKEAVPPVFPTNVAPPLTPEEEQLQINEQVIAERGWFKLSQDKVQRPNVPTGDGTAENKKKGKFSWKTGLLAAAAILLLLVVFFIRGNGGGTKEAVCVDQRTMSRVADGNVCENQQNTNYRWWYTDSSSIPAVGDTVSSDKGTFTVPTNSSSVQKHLGS